MPIGIKGIKFMGNNFNPFLNINLNIRIIPENSVIADYDFENNIAYIETHGNVRAMVTVRLEDVNTVQEFIQLLKFLRCSEAVTTKKEYIDFLAENPIFRELEPWEVIVHRILKKKAAKDMQEVCFQSENHYSCNIGKSELIHGFITGKQCLDNTKGIMTREDLTKTEKNRHGKEVLLTALAELIKDNTVYISPYGEYTIHAANENTALEYYENIPYEIKQFTEYPKAVLKYDNITGRNYIIGVLYRGIYTMPDGTEKEGYILSCEHENADMRAVGVTRDYINCMNAKRKICV